MLALEKFASARRNGRAARRKGRAARNSYNKVVSPRPQPQSQPKAKLILDGIKDDIAQGANRAPAPAVRGHRTPAAAAHRAPAPVLYKAPASVPHRVTPSYIPSGSPAKKGGSGMGGIALGALGLGAASTGAYLYNKHRKKKKRA